MNSSVPVPFSAAMSIFKPIFIFIVQVLRLNRILLLRKQQQNRRLHQNLELLKHQKKVRGIVIIRNNMKQITARILTEFEIKTRRLLQICA